MKKVFESQKTEKNNQSVFHHWTNHPTLCPIKIWASTIKRILNIPGFSLASTVNTVLLNDGSIQLLSNNYLITKLRLAVLIIGQEELGFLPTEIGLHSLCSSAAMTMFLAGISVTTIKLIARWGSEAFMDYIRPQVEMFSSLVSKTMISNSSFFTVPQHNHDKQYHYHFHNQQKKHGLCQLIMIPNLIIVWSIPLVTWTNQLGLFGQPIFYGGLVKPWCLRVRDNLQSFPV